MGDAEGGFPALELENVDAVGGADKMIVQHLPVAEGRREIVLSEKRVAVNDGREAEDAPAGKLGRVKKDRIPPVFHDEGIGVSKGGGDIDHLALARRPSANPLT